MLTAKEFGKTASGEAVTSYTLTNGRGTSVEVLSLGCAVRSFRLAGDNSARELCSGLDTVAEYEASDACMGAVPGRVCGRIENARFELNGKEYILPANAGEHMLHGGAGGFSRRVWQGRAQGDSLILSRVSPDGEEGFPGTVECEVRYTLGEDNSLTLDFAAVSDKDTYLSLTNHTYWNLGGEIAAHLLKLEAAEYVEPREDLLPTGRLLPVADTALDFREAAPVGDKAIDCSFPVKGEGLRLMAELLSPASGVTLRVYSTLPAIHVYTGECLPTPRSHLALEAQYIPNGMNNPFPTPLLPAGTNWRHRIVFEVGKA